MKLDRNLNPDRIGKYALVNMRRLNPLLKDFDNFIDKETGNIVRRIILPDELDDINAFRYLLRRGIISLGNESPNEQFFVLKYKDKFTGPALYSYSDACYSEAQKLDSDDLREFARQIMTEAQVASDIGNRIPD